jgi:XTP/dITP diphosphohydrolase
VAASGRVVLLVTSRRVPAGLLCLPAWQVLQEADAVLTGAPDHPLLPELAGAGIAVQVLADHGPADAAPSRAAQLLRAGAGATVVWLSSPDGDPGLLEELTRAGAAPPGQGLAAAAPASSPDPMPRVEVLTGSWDLPGAGLLDAVAVMDRLRSPGGCPWDAAQTHQSLVEYLVEETYEVVEAIETEDDADLREELGDLLLQVLFHARIAQEREGAAWGIDEVADSLVVKLVSRHPHVYGSATAASPQDVEASWERLKAREKGRASVTDGIPPGLPALVLAAKLLSRSGKGGVVVPLPDSAVSRAGAALQGVAGDSGLGEVLLALVAAARAKGWDAETALRAAVRRHRAAIRAAEGLPG